MFSGGGLLVIRSLHVDVPSLWCGCFFLWKEIRLHMAEKKLYWFGSSFCCCTSFKEQKMPTIWRERKGCIQPIFFVFLFQTISCCTYSHLKRVNIRDGRTWHSDTTVEDAVRFLSSHHVVTSYGVVADGPPKY